MKKYIFIALLFLFAYEAYPQIRLSTMDSVTTFLPTDIFWLNTKPTASFLNRKVSWSYLRSNMIDYIDGLANTWALRQTFTSGATFSANSGALGGSVTFNDSVVFAGNMYMSTPTYFYSSYIRPPSGEHPWIGTASLYYGRMYAQNFVVINPSGNDSVSITYDDSTLTFSKEVSMPNLRVTDNFAMDSAAALQSLKINPEGYTISNVTDSVITITSLMSNVLLATPGDVISPGIETINMDGAALGHIIILYQDAASDTVLFKDTQSDGNLIMGGDFYMGWNDVIAFMYGQRTTGSTALKWIEIWRKDN